MKTNEMILSGATLIIIGMGGWLLTTVNQLETMFSYLHIN